MKSIFFKLNTIFDKPEKFKLYLYLIFSFFTPVIEAMGIGSLVALIVSFFNKIEPGENFYLEKLGLVKDNFVFLDSIESVLFVVILIFCFRGIYLFFFHYFETNLRNALVASKSKTAYQKFMNFSYLEMKNSSKSEVFNLAVLEAARVIDFVIGTVNILREIILVIILSVSLFILNPMLTTILCTSLLIFSFIFLSIYSEKLYSVGEALRGIQKELLNLVNESVSSFKIIRLLNKKNFFMGNFNQITDIRKKNLFYQQFIKKIPKVVFETLIIISISLIVIFFNTENNISETLSFLAILGLISSRLVPSFSTLNVLYSTVKFNEASVDNFLKKFIKVKKKV
jgi:ABC-type multidrug transport system fused ATPase/permease subunit